MNRAIPVLSAKTPFLKTEFFSLNLDKFEEAQ